MNTPPKPSDLFPRRQPGTKPGHLRCGNAMTSPTRETVTEPKVQDTSARAEAADAHNSCELGNHELPIADYREQIVAAAATAQATIITAETGAGKSTQVPQFLAEAGYEVVVTQPRIVAARSVAERVRDEVVAKRGTDYADFVGYRTARERGDSDENQILFVTDGLQQVRELAGRGVGKKQVLVLDEVHEWNENMEVLVAWAKKRMNEDPNFKVVVMSATMEAGPLSNYFADNKRSVPVIEVPGRTFEVKKEEGGDVADEAIKFAREGKNTLVFAPGKTEIKEVIAEIQRANIPGATILPLHGQLEATEQRKVFAKYPGVKIIVATNVAQTSITIDDIDAVVDSGLERRKEVINNVEGLYLRPISRADCMQRAGRAGRTKAGEYVLAQLDNNPMVPLAERPAYGTPEILRTRLDGMVLRLAKNGFDASTMDFFHSKDDHGRDIKPGIIAAKERLQKLGALREDGSVTRIGRDMERMQVESHYARMMIEARKYGPEVQMQLAALLAVQEADGITQFATKIKPCRERWRTLVDDNFNDSDMIKQLEVFVKAMRMSDTQKREHDLFMKAFSKANDVLRQLRSVEKLQGQELSVPTAEQREQLLRCIVSGMVDNLYVSELGGYKSARGDKRELSSRSIVRGGKMIVGIPFDLQITTRRGQMTLNLLEGPTNVPSIELLREVAPQLFSEKWTKFVVLPDGSIGEEWVQHFNGQNMGQTEVREAPASAERTRFIIDQIIGRLWQHNPYQAIIDEIERLQKKTTERLTTITSSDLRGMLEIALPEGVASLDEARGYIPPVELDDVISLEVRMKIDDENPDEYNGIPITYRDGQPYMISEVSNEELVRVFGESGLLPNGKRVMVGSGYYARSVETVVAEAREAMIKEEAAHAKARLDAEGAAEGLPANVRIERRVGGATQNSMGWVICPDGTLREADTVPIDRYGRYENPDGTLIWDQIRPGELVLLWSKADVISSHNFETVHMPAGGLTDAQLARVAALQENIAKDWSIYDDRMYDSRGDRSSPPVGRGWGLDPQSAEKEAQRNALVKTVNDAIATLEGFDDLDDDLQKRCNTLLGRADKLLRTDAQAHHEYQNHVRQLTSLVDTLRKDVEARDAERMAAGVSLGSLEALKARFNG